MNPKSPDFNRIETKISRSPRARTKYPKLPVPRCRWKKLGRQSKGFSDSRHRTKPPDEAAINPHRRCILVKLIFAEFGLQGPSVQGRLGAITDGTYIQAIELSSSRALRNLPQIVSKPQSQGDTHCQLHVCAASRFAPPPSS